MKGASLMAASLAGGVRGTDIQGAAGGAKLGQRRHLLGVLDLQPGFAADEADAVHVLHGLRQVGHDRRVIVQLGESQGG